MDRVKRSICKCQVQCYGRGDVHEKIEQELHISPCEEPGVPCLLFVYQVSREIEDLRNALQWVTEKQEVKSEDISVVILLEKCLDKVSKPVEVDHQGLFDADTVVVRILWEQSWWNSSVKIQQTPSNKETMDRVKKSINKCQVQCYGRGDFHEKIVKELHISPCKESGVPYLLFVYEVSCQDEDLRNALQWVTEKQGVKREDISVVILLEKCLDKVSKPVEVDHQGLFDANTVVVRILWEQYWLNSPVKIQKSPSNKEVMDRVRSIISKCEGSSPEDSGNAGTSKHGPIQKSSQDDLPGSSSWTVLWKSSFKNKISSWKSGASRQEQSSQNSSFYQPTMDERNTKDLRNYLLDYKPPKSCVDSINILLFSLLGSEEPSVAHAFLSALDKRSSPSTDIPMGNNPNFPKPQNSQLKSYRAGKIKLWDTSGWNALENMDQSKRVLNMIVEGRVPDEIDLHSFNPGSDGDKYPVIPENVIHGVAFVTDISSEDTISDDTMNQLKGLHTVMAMKSIYSVVIGTKFEQSGIEENDHEKIYEYRPLQEKFKKLSHSTGMETRSMFVVSNQWSGQIKGTKCILALSALNNMVRNIDKYITATM